MADEADSVDDGDAIDNDALAAWTPMSPPADFVDRVMAAREADAAPVQTAPRRWPYVAGAVAATMAAGVALYVATARGKTQVAIGTLQATERTTAQLGERAVAVAEAGAALAWKIEGDAAVEQTAGDVFYRVDRNGEPFVVHTPAGDVRVTGTCFRIEVGDMNKGKQMVLSGAVGAALAAAVVVTVYEGHVVAETRGAKTELAAGTRATMSSQGDISVNGANVAAADPQATREQLLARTEQQRNEIVVLRNRLAEYEKKAGSAAAAHPHDDPAEEGRTWHDPSPERLAQWAKECNVRVDEPGLARFNPLKPGSRSDRGIEPSEFDAYNGAMAELAKQWHDQVRALYLEATGDSAGADTLSTDAMYREIEERATREEIAGVLQRISAERAGLAQPPADLGKTSAIERLMRGYFVLGDAAEAAVAKRLGADRAKAIRGDSWDGHHSMSGCPAELK